MSALFKARSSRLFVALLATCSFGLMGVAPAIASTTSPAAPSAKAPPDPAKAGPHDVTSTEYNDGDTAFTPPSLGHAVEVLASVHYPTDISAGPYPLIVLLHGRHSTCYEGSQAFGGWPCAAGQMPIPSYQGYDYLATNLASWGYVVISISADGINAWDSGTSDGGAMARAELIQYHLDKWKTFTTTGGAPFGKTFVGNVDLQNIGEMGHSRGGEGVVQSYVLNKSLGAPYGINAVLPLAPIDFNRLLINDVPLFVTAGYCDGDVSDNQGIHFYDDALYSEPNDNTPKEWLEIMGANHNFFNTIWTPGEFPAGAFDDWSGSSTDAICGPEAGSERLTAAQQRQVGLDYMAGFFRLYIGGETDLTPYFNGTETQPKSVKFADLHNAYQAPANQLLTVNNFMDKSDLKTNLLRGKVTEKGLSPFDLCGGASPEPTPCVTTAGSSQQPHTVRSPLSAKPGLSQLRFAWKSKSSYMTNDIPNSSADVSKYDAVSFRIAQNIGASNPKEDMSVVLTDADGKTSSVDVKKWSDALFQPLGNTGGLTPKEILNTVRIPLSAFKGVDLSKVASVTLAFNKTKAGSVLMTDLAFND